MAKTQHTTPLAALAVGLVLAACADNPVGLPDDRAWVPQATVVPASTTPFTGYIYGCSGSPGEELRITPGGTLHFFGASNTNQWSTGNPLLDGIEQNEVDANVNLGHGIVRARATATITPTAVNGTWEVHFTARPPFGASGVGHGTGDLEGLTMQFSATPVSGVANLCNAAFPFVASLQGVIIAPATSY